MTLKELFDRCKMIQQPDTVTGVTINSAPGVVYTVYAYLSAQPVEKWVSTLTGIFIALQMVFLLIDRFRKGRKK